MDTQRPMHKKRLSIEVTSGCNFNCQHCFNRPSSPTAPVSLGLDFICRVTDEAYDLGCRDVLLTGGEPLMWRHFGRFYEHLSRYTDLTVKLNTNASLIDEEAAALFAERPPANIHVGLYGWDEASYTAITGNPAGYASAVKGISLLSRNRLRFYLLVPGIRLLAENRAKVDAFAGRLGSELIVRDWILGDHVYRDGARNRLIRSVRLNPEEAARGLVREKGGVGKIIDELLRPSPRDYRCLFSCLHNYRQVIIDPHMNLLPCIILRHPEYAFSLRNTSLRDGLSFVQRLSTIPHQRTDEGERCGKCRIRGICRNCPANAYLEHGDYEGIGEYYCRVSQEIAGILGMRNEHTLSEPAS